MEKGADLGMDSPGSSLITIEALDAPIDRMVSQSLLASQRSSNTKNILPAPVYEKYSM